MGEWWFSPGVGCGEEDEVKVGAKVMDEFPHEVASGDLNGGASRPTDVDVTKVVEEPIFKGTSELEDTASKEFEAGTVV